MPRLILLGGFFLLAIYAFSARQGLVEVVEIGKHNVDLLPGGKEADGIIGDFVMRNGRIQLLVAGNLPLRRPNMTVEKAFETPGCLYDLDLAGESNDQLTVLRPGQLGGPLSFVQISNPGRGGIARLEAVRTAAKGEGLSIEHEYELAVDQPYVKVTSTYHNQFGGKKTISPRAVWKEFSQRWSVGAIQVGDSIDPFDKRSYAWAALQTGGRRDRSPRLLASPLPKEVDLPPGEERRFAIAVAVAGSPLEAYGILASLGRKAGQVAGTAADEGGAPAVHARVLVEIQGKKLPAYPDNQGNFQFQLPAGEYDSQVVDIGREETAATRRNFSVAAGRTTRLEFKLPQASLVEFDIRDQSGGPSPCKVQFIGRNGTPTPNLGSPYRARGCDHQYHSHNGRFAQQLPPGTYLLRITRGPEFDMVEKTVQVRPGQSVKVSGTLKRTVDTQGWISTDYHSHSTPSGDNYCNTDDRIINLVAEHIEFAPTTEHNRIYDWQPHIDRLGLKGHLKTIVGLEHTGSGQHFNSFPLRSFPYQQDGGTPPWQYDPRLNAIVLRNAFGGGADRWVQINHPGVGIVFNDRNQDQIADGGYAGFEDLIDAGEFWSDQILNPSPFVIRQRGGRTVKGENRTFGWLQLLNQGRNVWCVAVSDAHGVFSSPAGDWRTYVPSSTDRPGRIDHREIIRNSKAGRMMISNGPFLQVETADGMPIGSQVVSEGFIDLEVKVQTSNWLEVDRVQILVNGRQHPKYNYTRSKDPSKFKGRPQVFEETIRVNLQEDAHLIVVATGEESDLSKGWGQAGPAAMHPVAYTNPIFVDVDGQGFKPSGDNLGHPLLVAPSRR